MAKQTTREALAVARWWASKVAPYLSRGLFAMTFVESTDLPTIGVDEHWRVYANPEYVSKCAADGTLVGEIIHEVLHPTLRHPMRERAICATDHAHWNGCADAELDQRIEEMGHKRLKLVSDRITPEMLGGTRGMTAEELYKLPRQQQQQKKRCGGGSGASGQKEPWEKPCTGGHGDAFPGLTEAQAKILTSQIAQDVKAFAGKKPGSVPLGILRWAEMADETPPLPWQTLTEARIAYCLDQKRGSHPSYARPSRRNMGGLVLPVHRAAMPKVGIVVDTSASMQSGDLGIALAIAYDACSVLGTVFAVACDAAAGEVAEIRHVDDLRPYLTGGGGTNLGVGIAALQETVRPDAIVVVTDGGTPWPAEELDVPMVVVLTQPANSYMMPPAWAADVIQAA